jgi:hypothetical protein
MFILAHRFRRVSSQNNRLPTRIQSNSLRRRASKNREAFGLQMAPTQRRLACSWRPERGERTTAAYGLAPARTNIGSASQSESKASRAFRRRHMSTRACQQMTHARPPDISGTRALISQRSWLLRPILAERFVDVFEDQQSEWSHA